VKCLGPRTLERDAVILEDNEVALAGPAFDQPPSLLRCFVVIATSGRSGSHMLSRLLKQLGYGIPVEYYHTIYRDSFAHRWGVKTSAASFLIDFFDALISHRTTNGTCAVKCLQNQFAALSAGLAARSPVPGLCYIHLWRRDSLAQAISYRLAQQSGVWNFTAEPTTTPNRDLDIFDLDALAELRCMLTAEEQNWRQHFQQCGVPVAHVAYEDLVRNREQELRRLITFIDPARPLASTLVLNEPASGEALRARQYVSAAGREALYKAYEERFGPVVPLPEPGKVGVRVGSG